MNSLLFSLALFHLIKLVGWRDTLRKRKFNGRFSKIEPCRIFKKSYSPSTLQSPISRENPHNPLSFPTFPFIHLLILLIGSLVPSPILFLMYTHLTIGLLANHVRNLLWLILLFYLTDLESSMVLFWFYYYVTQTTLWSFFIY